MKKIVLMAAFLSLGMFQVSCDKEDNEDYVPVPTLVGKWNYSKSGTMVGQSEVLSDYDGNEPGCTKDYIVFDPNGALLDVDFDSTDSPCEELSEVGTYSVTGNTLTVNFGEGAESVQILNLSFTELKIKSAEGIINVFTR